LPLVSFNEFDKQNGSTSGFDAAKLLRQSSFALNAQCVQQRLGAAACCLVTEGHTSQRHMLVRHIVALLKKTY
jgi:hypothetical protein